MYNRRVRRLLVITLTFIGLVVLITQLGWKILGDLPLFKSVAGVRVESTIKSKVFLNGKEAGQTPLQLENLDEGEYLVRLDPIAEATASSKTSWQGYVKLNGGTLTVVNRELADSKAASSGEVITLEKGSGVTLISTPVGAEVMVDDKSYGVTPITISDLTHGEHQFVIGKDNFLKRSIRASVVEGYNLNISVDLAIGEIDLSKLITPPETQMKEAVVKQTPTGFLRVRSRANTTSSEVSRVNTGETLIVLEELPSWTKIRTKDGKEGYVATVYIDKKRI